jgi:hypothetical protein
VRRGEERWLSTDEGWWIRRALGPHPAPSGTVAFGQYVEEGQRGRGGGRGIADLVMGLEAALQRRALLRDRTQTEGRKHGRKYIHTIQKRKQKHTAFAKEEHDQICRRTGLTGEGRGLGAREKGGMGK